MHDRLEEQPINLPLVLQSAYFLVTGVWPLLHYRSFEAITGPKVDDWLVRVVGALIAVIGGVIAFDALGSRQRPQTYALSYASAAVLAVIEAWYALKRRISFLYFLDAILEFVLVGLIERSRRQSRETARW